MNTHTSMVYVPVDSPVHSLNPFFKLISFLALVIAVINAGRPAEYIIPVLICIAAVIVSGIPFSCAFGYIRKMWLFFAVIFFMNFCFYDSSEPFLKLWILTPSYEGLIQGINVVIRVFLVLLLSNILTASTPPIALTDAFSLLLSPLRLFRIPVGLIAMIMSVAIQFVPTLIKEADTIKRAQTARGAGFESHNIFKKAKAILPMAIPIFINAFKRADELSLAMEARGYSGTKGQKLPSMPHISIKDVILFIISLSLCILLIIF